MESGDRFCWSCGSGIYNNDRFCRKCGVDLRERRPIEQGHETKPEATYTPAPTPTPEVVVKEVPAAPTSSPKPEIGKAKPPLGPIATIALYVIGALGWGVVALAVFMAVTGLLNNNDGVRQGNYWGVMNIVADLLFVGVGFIVAKLCGRALRPRINRLDVPVADVHKHRSYRALLMNIYKKAISKFLWERRSDAVWFAAIMTAIGATLLGLLYEVF